MRHIDCISIKISDEKTHLFFKQINFLKKKRKKCCLKRQKIQNYFFLNVYLHFDKNCLNLEKSNKN